MREHDEVYADTGVPVEKAGGVSRGTALKVGGLGLAGALTAFLPGRARAAVRKYAVTNTCSSVRSTTCGQGPVKCDFSEYCSCITVYTKIQKPGGTTTMCAAGFANDFNCNGQTCLNGTGCPPGWFCADPKSTCCSKPVCVPLCSYGT